jgi:hypothetical protein
MKNFIYLALALPLFACTVESSSEATVQASDAVVMEASAVNSPSSVVKCGCDVEGIGACGNYVEVDGTFLKINNSSAFELGPMNWCSGKNGHALVEGTRTGDEIELTRLEMVE